MTPDDRRILAALDEGDTAAVVLAVARRVAHAVDAQPVAVHVGDGIPLRLAELVAAADVPHHLLPGTPVEVLTDRLRRPGVVAAVVGCRTPDGPRPAGHVATHLVQHAPVPVVVVPPGTGVGDEPLRHVLLPLDGSHETTAAVDPAVATLAGSGLRITVAHVFDAAGGPRCLDQPHHGLDAWGREFLERHAAPGLDIVLRAGRPGEQLLDVVAATEPDLVVLGWAQDLTSGRARTIRALLTSSPVPLLLVPTDGVGGAAAGPRIATDDGPDW